jgi:hypothetical protein
MKKTNLNLFDYENVAKADADMWRSYYNHQFFKMFLQLFKVLKAQIRLDWFKTFRMAYYSSAAAADYRIKRGHENSKRVTKYIAKFYKVISDNSKESFDCQKAAELEYEWWDIHRYPKNTKKIWAKPWQHQCL